eukprot:SAG31_NODE_1053_length_10144_cov_117.540866_8_plen_180_part_00
MERHAVSGRHARRILGAQEVAISGPPLGHSRQVSAQERARAGLAGQSARIRPSCRPRSAHTLMARETDRMSWDGVAWHRNDVPSASALRKRTERPSKKALISSAVDFFALLERELLLMGLRSAPLLAEMCLLVQRSLIVLRCKTGSPRGRSSSIRCRSVGVGCTSIIKGLLHQYQHNHS